LAVSITNVVIIWLLLTIRNADFLTLIVYKWARKLPCRYCIKFIFDLNAISPFVGY